jgi:PPK2 family polyphosphate:nucleotide phosphotransferase
VEAAMDLLKFTKHFLVEPGQQVKLAKDFDPRFSAGLDKDAIDAGGLLEQGIEMLATYQEKLYAENRQALLVIIQALDAAGKDSVIKHVMSGINPTGVQVTSFKAPSTEELDHDYLWRVTKALPGRGMIGIFNRSHYEEVIVVRVHPEFLDGQRLPPGTVDEGLWKQRFEEINNFERYLVNQGTQIVKIYLNVSKEEQRERQLERIDRPEKNWKFNAGDIQERGHWEQYVEAFQDVFRETSTPWAPWYVVPADRKWFTRLAVAGIIAEKLIEMDPQFPVVSEEDRQEMLAARAALVAEDGPKQTTAKPAGAKAEK